MRLKKNKVSAFMKSKYPIYFIIPGLVLYVVFAIYPTLSNLYYSFTDWSIKVNDISFIGFEQFKRVLENDQFFTALGNTVMYALGTTIGKTGLGLLLAIALNRKMRGKNILRSIYFFPTIISTVALGLLFQALLNPYGGAVNNVLGLLGVNHPPMWIADPQLAIWCCVLLGVWAHSGVTMAIFLSGMQAIPNEYYQASQIDGANSWQKFKNITWPLLRPALTISVVLNFTTGLRGFEVINFLTGGGPGNSSQTLMTLAYKYMGEGLFAYSATISLLLIIIILILGIPLIKAMTKSEVEL